MSSGHSISNLLPDVKRGDQVAFAALYERCYEVVSGTARGRLSWKPLRDFDAEDIANSALRELQDRAARGGFQQLEDRNDVFEILTRLLIDKIAERRRYEGRKKRDADVESLHDQHDAISTFDEPSLQAEYAELRARFLAALPTDLDRDIVDLLESGQKKVEIANRLGVTARTVARHLETIRSIAGHLIPPSNQ